jgi:hypothetical protein
MAQIQELEASKDIHLIRIFDKLENELFKDIDIMIAGGSVRKAFMNTDLGRSDIDIFFKSDDDFNAAKERLNDLTAKVYSNPNCVGANIDRGAFNLGLDQVRLQLIRKRFYSGFDSLFEDFDFNICQFGYRNGAIITTIKALADHRDKVLRFSAEGSAQTTSANRLYKYLCRGYSPTLEVIENAIIKENVSLAPWSVSLMDQEEEYGIF